MKTNHVLRSAVDISRRFPHIAGSEIARIAEFNKRFRFGVSDEMLDYFFKDEHGVPLRSDPLARHYWPFPDLITASAPDGYDPRWDNWEMPSDFPILGNFAWQWKYTDRICHRSFGCAQYCLYCFEALRTLDKNTHKKARSDDWAEGVAFVRAHPEINEVIFSGGEPLIAPDHVLVRYFTDVRACPNVKTIRIHTAKGIHDTGRFTDEFAALCRRFSVTEIALHILHPRQVTPRFIAAMERLARGCGSMIRLAHIPILRDVNDNADILKELCTKLVEAGVKPYYALHSMPSTLGAKSSRLSVWRMIEALRPLVGRAFSHMRCPEPIIVPRGGKKTIPMERTRFWLHQSQIQEHVWAIDNTMQPLGSFALARSGDILEFDGTPKFMYAAYRGQPVIVFENWRGKWEMYPDAPD